MMKRTIILLAVAMMAVAVGAQTAMQNVYGRGAVSLCGKWNALADWACNGEYRKVWEERTPQGKTDFFEFSFDGMPLIDVPGDFNTQIDQMRYSECWVWYKTVLNPSRMASPSENPSQKSKLSEDWKASRLFLYFGAVNYKADVWLNGEHIGGHEGGFTPFQIEVTGRLREGDNSLIVRADNRRRTDALPAEGFDWFGYGGITREVFLVETPQTYIDDYFIGLGNSYVQLNGKTDEEKVTVEIPELKYKFSALADENGRGELAFKHKKLQLWSPENPKLYDVILSHGTEKIKDRIGFRTITTEGNKILLNGKEIFLKAVNIHEEVFDEHLGCVRRAYSEEDARRLLSVAKEMGCNMVRLAHYPHSEHTVRLAEEMGIMVWDEIPVYQGIEFKNPKVCEKIERVMAEMVKRDKNRCAVIVWSLSNETWDSYDNRTAFLTQLTPKCKVLDLTRLVTHVINTQGYNDNRFRLWDPLYEACDFLCLNEYIGWYSPWQGEPSALAWDIEESIARTAAGVGKPVFISEFGGESKFQSNFGPKDAASYWSEEYQVDIYRKQIEMFRATREKAIQKPDSSIINQKSSIINISGVCPWILFDYLSLVRMHPVYQNGFNRKGLVDEHGNRKQAFHLMREFYESFNPNK